MNEAQNVLSIFIRRLKILNIFSINFHHNFQINYNRHGAVSLSKLLEVRELTKQSLFTYLPCNN